MSLRLLGARLTAVAASTTKCSLTGNRGGRWMQVAAPALSGGARLVSTSSIRYNADKKKDTEPPKSILTDDLLAKVGVDLDEPQGSKGESAQEPKPETSESSGSSDGKPRPKRRAQTSTDKKRERYANFFYLGLLVGSAGAVGYLSRDWDDDEDEQLKKSVPNGYTPNLMWNRFKTRFNTIFTYFQEPPFPDLLPDSPPEPYKRPLTLVLTLDDLLVHSEWGSKTGWKTAKRPGVDYFLGYLSQYYEIVLFSSNYMMYCDKIVEKLDPLHAFISYQLYKEHCLYKDGAHIKDLSKLNRDLSKVLIIDVDDDSIQLQPENAVKLPKWDGKADDELIKLIPFLEYLATQQVKDVRPILASFNDKGHIPEEFAKRVEKLRTEFNNDQAKKNSSNFFGKLLGLPGMKQKFPLDAIHDEGVKNYEYFLKLVKEEEAKLKEQAAMPKETFKLKDIVEGNIPTQEEMMKRQLEKQQEYEKQQAVQVQAAK